MPFDLTTFTYDDMPAPRILARYRCGCVRELPFDAGSAAGQAMAEAARERTCPTCRAKARGRRRIVRC